MEVKPEAHLVAGKWVEGQPWPWAGPSGSTVPWPTPTGLAMLVGDPQAT